jgi:hypothetical protein
MFICTQKKSSSFQCNFHFRQNEKFWLKGMSLSTYFNLWLR